MLRDTDNDNVRLFPREGQLLFRVGGLGFGLALRFIVYAQGLWFRV